MSNPALRQESRYEPAVVIPIKQEHSLLEWLESHNRLIPREALETEDVDDDNEDVEVQDLMSDDSYSGSDEDDSIDIDDD